MKEMVNSVSIHSIRFKNSLVSNVYSTYSHPHPIQPVTYNETEDVVEENLPLDLSTAPQHPRMKSPHGSVQLNPSNEPNFSKQRFKKGVKATLNP